MRFAYLFMLLLLLLLLLAVVVVVARVMVILDFRVSELAISSRFGYKHFHLLDSLLKIGVSLQS